MTTQAENKKQNLVVGRVVDRLNCSLEGLLNGN